MRPAYITAIRSQVAATTPRSWVTSTTLIASSSRRSRISFRIWSWIVTSSAVVGSSARSSFGSLASAMAIITRWRIPPENWWGYSRSRRAASGMPTRSMRSRARAARPARSRPVWARRFSSIWLRTGRTGLSAVIGSWKIIEIWPPRMPRSSRSRIVRRSRPCQTPRPRSLPEAGTSRTDRAQGDALARAAFADEAQHLAGITAKDTSLTAVRRPSPKAVERWRTSSSGSAAGGVIAWSSAAPPARRRSG